MNEQTMEKFKEMFTNGFNGLTKQEFLKSFEAVVEMVLKIQKKNDAEIKAMWDLVEDIKSSNGQELKDVKDKAMSYCMAEMEKVYKEHDRKISEMDQKMIEMKDGEDANEEEIVKSVLEQIKLPEYKEIVLDTPEQLRNKLETLKDNERLDVSAIKGIEELIKQNRTLGGTVGGLISSKIRFIDDETPTGDIDGSNTVFTLSKFPATGSLKVYRGGARQRVTEDYTFDGKTITFTIAPVAGEIILCDFRY